MGGTSADFCAAIALVDFWSDCDSLDGRYCWKRGSKHLVTDFTQFDWLSAGHCLELVDLKGFLAEYGAAPNFYHGFTI